MLWDTQFLELFRQCLAAYKGGNHDFMSYYSENDLTFLKSIGYQPREFFDFVEDLGDGGEPTESAALLVAAARRDYFLAVQNGQPSDRVVGSNDVPSRDEKLNGIAYLPRIIAKAQAKLRGELDPDLMFSCGGDRNFLRTHGPIHPADFLRQVWAADGDNQRIADFVQRS